MGVLRQSCGGSSSGTGISNVTISGCLNGSGIPSSPLSIKIDPTGLIGCGADGLKLLNAPSGGGAGTPASPLTSVQFNNGGAFGGSSGLVWDGTNLKITGGGIQIDGTTNLYPMLTNSASTTSEMQARLADNSDLANFRAKFIYLDATGIRFNAAGNGIGVITQADGLDFARFCFGGTTSLFPALKKVGTALEVRLADDSAYTALRTSAINLSTDVILERDAANNLAIRNSNASQALRVYKNYNSSVSYERGVFDWQTTSGTLRIGTENAGAGNVATPLTIVTSGTPRISIAASGAITFNQAYTFPTDLGTSGQVLRNHGGGLIKWGTVSGVGGGTGSSGVTSLAVSLTGGGTHADPTTAVSLVYNNSSGTNVIDFRPLIYFNFGQAGTLSAEGAITDQPRFIVPEGFQIEICRAYLSVGSPGDDVTSVQLQRYVPITGCGEPSTDGTPFSKDLDGGCTFVRWTEVEGITLDSLAQLNFRVLTPGTNAMNLVAHFWARTTVCYEP